MGNKDIGALTGHVPVLEFDTQPEEISAPDLEKKENQVPASVKIQPEDTEKHLLSPEEEKQIDAFVNKIDLSNSGAVLNYGAGTQKKMAEFSEQTLDSVRSKDLGEVGGMVTQLVGQLREFDIDEKDRGFLRNLFKKNSNRIATLQAKYNSVEENVELVAKELDRHQVTLQKDIRTLDRMYELNLSYYKELTMYIIAGKRKLEEVRSTDLKEFQEKAQKSGLPEDAQAAKDLSDLCDRFEKKLHDLELTRTVAMQTGPQIRMIQASDTLMSEKIQSTIVNTIPLWKNQMVIALGIEHASQAARAQREVSDMTNELLKKNADALKMAAVESANESERGIVDIETLKHTNEMLLSTMDEVIQIQEEGKEKRREAEKELTEIESQLRDKLLEASGGKDNGK